MNRTLRRFVLLLVLLLAVVIILLLVRCSNQPPAPPPRAASVATPPAAPAAAATPTAKDNSPAEVLTSATVQVPAAVAAGATFRATWTGPDNSGDYLTVVRPAAKATEHGNYRETRQGAVLELVAPIEAGEWEVRYVTSRSKTILARAALTVTATTAVLTAVDAVVAGAPVAIAWTGPNHAGDYICIVPEGAPDSQVGNYGEAIRGSPLTVAAPVQAGATEIRYVSGAGRKVLGRRKLLVLAPDVVLAAPATVIAGARFAVTWQGPANAGDYLTVVPRGTPDGQYRNYTDTAKGSPLELTAPMEIGEAEIRYMTGAQARVLARRSIHVTAAAVNLDAAAQATAGAPVTITWSGPNHPGDYLTIVSATTPDGQYGNYTNASKGSPLIVTAPGRAGAAEIRYMSGQGAKVLARRPLAIMAAAAAR